MASRSIPLYVAVVDGQPLTKPQAYREADRAAANLCTFIATAERTVRFARSVTVAEYRAMMNADLAGQLQ